MAEKPEQGAKVIDLMEALRASLEKKGVKPAPSAREEAQPASTGRKAPRRAAAPAEAPAPARARAKK
jgi:DNA end-binding protein Ku